MYAVTVQTVRKVGGFEGSVPSPTFYLDENVQGIISEAHARKIVEDWLGFVAPAATHHITVVKV
jgi:hypothetical protein